MIRITRGEAILTIAAPSPGLQPEDYDEIEAAVMETARGRAFLSEHARRARAEDTRHLRNSLAKIEARLDALGAPPKVEAVPIVARLDKLVWTLRESGVDDFVCSKLEKLARDLAAGGVILASPAEAQSARPHKNPSIGASAGPEPLGGDQAVEPATKQKECQEAANKAAPSPASLTPAAQQKAAVPASSPISLKAPPAAAPPENLAPPTINVAPRAPAIDPRLEALSWLDRLPLGDRMALFA